MKELTVGTKVLNSFLGAMVVVLIAILIAVVGCLILAAVGVL
ncbi:MULTISPECIES: hypothetical protein [Cellulophaga]|uniref:Uncharacterized protein n=1 Tax=Cellulophaga lytica (strain ATCC 23178 / DSM 7489 / JCM 8516 / NBRC 14961 / NCIMB 1423 / VKM B-1433 / Cy l20) TaxID=867900 RepID=F0RA98_CELLC|nr:MULTISPECIES: hypothetical protein [Cellulophaga]ADY29442.1 hypothetical protein Celly_1618 [Cellulophaga lytica DSM 7489]MDO6490004.1 hypothetical protein [Cellulophaga sp. 2_MG-2023]MDO6494802.1 hypothetical protein [Cellulophaga sp. 3_MG-2023]MDO6852230.1 hypothetical protein [Cellulophaga lytica]PKB42363.1 hypothetical protein AX016_0528 [Cellulophaga sp. RHA19]